MKYKIDQSVSKIISRILLIVNGTESIYESGEQLANAEFDKSYLIDTLGKKDNMIVITLKENDRINDTSWCGEEQVSYF